MHSTLHSTEVIVEWSSFSEYGWRHVSCSGCAVLLVCYLCVEWWLCAIRAVRCAHLFVCTAPAVDTYNLCTPYSTALTT